jgi:hypothetical protein
LPNAISDGRVSVAAIIAIGAFLTFVVALLFMSAEAYDRATEDYQASQAYTETQREFRRRCASLEGDEIFECLEKQIEAAREPGRSEEDVQAQKQMARWAWWMLIVTGSVGFGTIAVAYIGVIYVRDTLRANTAAVEQAREANRILRMEQRPWLAMEDNPRAISPLRFNERGAELDVELDAENVGKSPAASVHTDIQMMAFPAGHRPMQSFLTRMIDGKGVDPLIIMQTIQRMQRRRPRRDQYREHGVMIFPNSSKPCSRGVNISRKFIDEVKSDDEKFEIIVFVCIDYLIIGSNEGSRQSATIFHLEWLDRSAEGEPGQYRRIFEIGRDVDATDLLIVPYSFNAYYAD